ncbi:MAG: GreA/GreB family elongation factor [Candidatus Nomurabacteria bacterium]|jgi:transcription elongation GreA/GreB family factor|nr:GreA/GreB family elongation factor [Candidatus Nomurabacteria bacterium]
MGGEKLSYSKNTAKRDLAGMALDGLRAASEIEVKQEKVGLDSYVEVEYIESGEVCSFLITDHDAGMLPEEVVAQDSRLAGVLGMTINSPVGGAIFGKAVGETVPVRLPKGNLVEVKIIATERLNLT